MIYTIGEILILLIAAVLLGLLLGWLIWGRGRGDLHAECQQRLADAEGRLATATTDRDATAAKLASIEEGHGPTLRAPRWHATRHWPRSKPSEQVQLAQHQQLPPAAQSVVACTS